MRSLGIVSLLALMLFFGGQPAFASKQSSLEQMILVARTSSDHDAIAARFDDLAKDSQKEAAVHARMLESYHKNPGMWRKSYHIQEHCQELLDSANADAKRYQELADAHRSIAKTIGAPVSPALTPTH